jgi:hypothetical protein
MLWGNKRGHNGFKYESCGDVRLIVKIQQLHPLVYQKIKITNNSIVVIFTCGFVD